MSAPPSLKRGPEDGDSLKSYHFSRHVLVPVFLFEMAKEREIRLPLFSIEKSIPVLITIRSFEEVMGEVHHVAVGNNPDNPFVVIGDRECTEIIPGKTL
jgi:hypothetical protein